MSTTFWIQFLGIVFGLVMMYLTFLKYKRRELRFGEFGIWQGGWIVLIIIAIVPYALDPIIAPLHFYRRLDFFVVFGFFVLLMIGFYSYSAVRRMEKKVEKFVREDALKNTK